MVAQPIDLKNQLERLINSRTSRRVRDLSVELTDELVVLRGQAGTYYVKQLAQHSVRDMLPAVALENAIVVA